MDSVEISAYSEDELDYEYQDDEVNSRNVLPNASKPDNTNLKNQRSLRRDSADEEGEDDDESYNDADEDMVAAIDRTKASSTVVVDSRSLEDEEDEEDIHLKRRSPIVERIVRGGRGYVDLDDVAADGSSSRRKSSAGGRKSIHERVVITAHRRHSTARQFGIDLEAGKPSKNYVVDARDVRELFESLDVDPADSSLRKHSIYVKGVDKLSEFEVKRIFAEFEPDSVQFVDDASCTVRWTNEESVVRMFLGMTKTLRRVRGPKKAEEGELVESDDEEEVGQLKEENGEDVAVVGDAASDGRKGAKRKRAAAGDLGSDSCVEINVEEVKLPSGKWRVVTKHVPDNRLLIARFATGFDVRRGVIHARNRPRPIFPDEEPRSNTDRDGFEYKWKTGQTKVRPGLNVFDGKGNELEWDYEHDTRFFASDDESSSSNGGSVADNDDAISYSTRKKRARRAEKKNKHGGGDDNAVEKSTAPPASTVTTTMVGDVQIRSRGRGSKKFLAAMASSDDDNDNAAINAGGRSGGASENAMKKLPTLASDAVKPSQSMPASRPKSADATRKPSDFYLTRQSAHVRAGERASHHNDVEEEEDDDELEDYDELADVLLGAASPRPSAAAATGGEEAMDALPS